MAARRNLVVVGGTGSGKTTLLNALAGSSRPTERIVTVEDTAELSLQHPHVVRLEARRANSDGVGEVSIRQLVINALRMRPDRIVVGEVRGAEVLDMAQAMNTGHEGSLSTCHANSPQDALRRLEAMALLAGGDLPLPSCVSSSPAPSTCSSTSPACPTVAAPSTPSWSRRRTRERPGVRAPVGSPEPGLAQGGAS